MKLSQYTYLFEKAGKYYLYNSQSGLLASLEKTVYESLYNKDFESLDKFFLDTLVKKGVVVEDDQVYNYYYKKRQEYFAAVGNNESLNLVIAPTSGCNFACPYCFEGEKANKRMSPEVIDSLIGFIKSYKETKKLSITWYGGEPLSAFDLMVRILERTKSECPQMELTQSIVTNGYLANAKVVEFLKNEGFKNIQITFDGLEANHNKTRYLKGSKKPTYRQIMDNVDRLVAEMPTECIISLRININKDNEEDFYYMYRLIKEKYHNDRVFVYPGFIREDSKDGSQMCYKSISGKSVFDFYKRLEERGMNIDFYPHKKNKGCMICSNNSLIIGPEGEIYKCWNDFNNPEKIIGNVKYNRIIDSTLLGRYTFEATPYADEKCKECKLFPVCDGGCGWERYQNTFNHKNYNLCSILTDRVLLEESLLKKCDMQIDRISAF